MFLEEALVVPPAEGVEIVGDQIIVAVVLPYLEQARHEGVDPLFLRARRYFLQVRVHAMDLAIQDERPLVDAPARPAEIRRRSRCEARYELFPNAWVAPDLDRDVRMQRFEIAGALFEKIHAVATEEAGDFDFDFFVSLFGRVGGDGSERDAHRK